MNKKASEKIISYSILAIFGVGIVLSGFVVGNIVFKANKGDQEEIVEETPVEIVEEPVEIPEAPEEPEIVEEPEDTDDGREITEEVFEEYISYETVEKDDSSLELGKTRVIQEGALGRRTFLYRVTVENGSVVKRELISQEVTVKPEDRIILVGSKIMPVITTKTVYEAETIPYETEYVSDVTQFVGYEKVTTQGRNGELIKTIKITYKDGKESGREVTKVETRKEAVTAVVVVGTKELPVEEPIEEPIEDPIDGESVEVPPDETP